MESRIKHIFSDKLVTIKESQNLQMADELMTQHRIRHLPVLNREELLVGILSRADFLALKKADFALKDYKVKDLMTSPVKVFAPNAKVRAVAQLFIAKKISCGLVLDSNEIVGIVTSDDLIRMLAESEELNDEMQRLDFSHKTDIKE